MRMPVPTALLMVVITDEKKVPFPLGTAASSRRCVGVLTTRPPKLEYSSPQVGLRAEGLPRRGSRLLLRSPPFCRARRGGWVGGWLGR